MLTHLVLRLQLYEAFKAHALSRTNLDDEEALGKMIDRAIKIKPDDALSKSSLHSVGLHNELSRFSHMECYYI